MDDDQSITVCSPGDALIVPIILTAASFPWYQSGLFHTLRTVFILDYRKAGTGHKSRPLTIAIRPLEFNLIAATL